MIHVSRILYTTRVDSDSADRRRTLSRAAFGQQHRLDVMLAAAHSEDGLVCLTDVARDLNLNASNVQGALKSLVAVGLLSEMPRGDGRRKFYLRNPSPAWDWAKEMAQQALGTVDPQFRI